MDLTSLLDKMKVELRPAKTKLKEIDSFVEQINELLRKKGLQASCVTGGSVGKGTNLRNSFDVDLFVQFDYKYKDDDISALLKKAICGLRPLELYGSRNYFQIHGKYTFELVPVLAVDDYRKAKNVTDMSPLHIIYVRNHTDKKSQLADEIRLAKQFCKSAGCYGAESYVSGFSGHVLDILVIHYGSLLNLLSAAAESWNEKQVLDPELHLDNPEEELNKSKRQSPLILVDPLQPDRNAAAALSKEKYELFRKRAKAFLDEPSEKFFRIQEYDDKYLRNRLSEHENSVLVKIEIEPVDSKKDVSGAKMLKIHEYVIAELADFDIKEAGWKFGYPSVHYYILENKLLPEFKEQEGPPVKNKKHYTAFITKHPDDKLFVKDKRVYALVKRKHRTFRQKIDELLQSKYVKERSAKVHRISYIERE